MVIWALLVRLRHRPAAAHFGHSVGGTDLGFWFAQQGSILTFIVLIFCLRLVHEPARQRVRRRRE
jgi:putative solute:sodium symporter small subunit